MDHENLATQVAMIDEIVFYCSLLLCISLCSYYKNIENPDMKRNYGAGLGILVTTLICGYNIYHSIFLVWGNIIIIKCCDKRYVHQVSIAYTWTYLLYLHFNLNCSIYVIWLHQTMALRLVGLAFEMNTSEQRTATRVSSVKLPLGDIDGPMEEPSAVEIIAYAYFFIGLQKGPYYRWKIFHEHFNSPFGKLGNCRIITENKLKKALICAVGYYLLSLKFTSNVYEEDDFYLEHGSDYRFLYNVPQMAMFFLNSQMVMMLCTSVFTEAGFGVYPAKCEPEPGHGPTARMSLMILAANKPAVAFEQEYNFAMLKCFDNIKVIIGPKMKDSLKGWEMPTWYWFWANIYSRFLQGNKEVRSASSFFAWTVWYGPTLQHIILTSTLWVYIHLESEYTTLCNTPSQMKMPWNIGFSIMRLFCLIYLSPCLIITDTNTVLRYYHSIFWMYHFLLVMLIVGAIIAYKTKQYVVQNDNL